MENTVFKREEGHTYILFRGSDSEDTQIEMIRRNKIPGLAPFHEEWEDNRWYYGYDITGAQPLFRMLEFCPLTSGEAGDFIDQLAGLLRSLERFLLPGSGLLLKPEYLYLYPEKKQYCFFFCLEQEGAQEVNIRELVWRLIENADEKDEALARLLFQFCRLCARGELEAEALLSCLAAETEKEYQRGAERGIGTETEGETDYRRSVEAELETEKKLGRRQDRGRTASRAGKRFWKGLFRRSPPMNLWDDLEPEAISERLRKEAKEFPVSKGRSGAEGGLWPENGLQIKDELGIERILWLENGPPTKSGTGMEAGLQPEEEPQPEGGPRTEILYVEEAEENYPVFLCRKRNEKLVLTEFPFYIGTQTGVQYDPKQKGISRLHAKLEKRAGSYWITDLNSTNGTRVDDVLLAPNEERRLVSGSRISLAGLEYEFMEFDITGES